jgi:hypothetical protein
MDSPHRSLGSFWITFKTSAELDNLSRSELNSVRVLPGVVPTDRDTLGRLAIALAVEVGGSVEGYFYSREGSTFSIKDASDSAVIGILAKDPRLASIGANIMQGHVDGAPSQRN